ncbi:MAG: hypothetical protein ACYTG3_18620 [Planctomycetota bacterium]
MRGTWLIVAVAATLLVAGCAKSKPQIQEAAQEGAWPHIECPPGSGITAALRLNEIIGWAQADSSPKAMEARGKAEECARDHFGTRERHWELVFAAWTHANEVATNPALPPHRKQELWQACVDELTHGPDPQ